LRKFLVKVMTGQIDVDRYHFQAEILDSDIQELKLSLKKFFRGQITGAFQQFRVYPLLNSSNKLHRSKSNSHSFLEHFTANDKVLRALARR